MPAGNWTGESTYQTWIATLRRWAVDPTISLADLPTLDAATFTPSTYELLFKHLRSAIESVMTIWNTKLQRLWDESPDNFELGRRLVELRAFLRYRVELCGHPALPGPVRDQLTDQCRTDIERLQHELEASVLRLPARTGANRSQVDELLGIVREHSFVGVYTPAAVAPVAPAPKTTTSLFGLRKSAAPRTPPRRGRRTIDPNLISE